MQTYTHYKDSGIDWIGQIPEHWETKKMKYLFIDFSKKNMANETLLSVTQNQGVVPREWVENRMVMPSGNLESFKYIEKGDFCISLRSFEGGLEYCFHSGIVSPAYTVLKGIFKHHDGYYKYLFKSQIFINELQLSIVGIREGKNISYELLKYDFLPIPPIQEQEAIANFLDEKTAKIDALVQTKEQQIEKLKELRQAKIHQAVTKGLDASAPTKDSGVEWIGEIPAHWEVKRLKNFSSVVLGKMLCNEDKGNYDYKPYLKSKNIQWLNVNIDSVENMWFSKYEQDIFRLKKGDLILSEGGEVGKVCIWNDELAECYIQNSAHKVTVNTNNSSKYHLYNLFTAGKLGLFDSIVNKVSIGHLTREKLINIFLPIPPIQEQEQIVAYLDEVTGKIDQAIAQKQEQITKLKEYKQSLINDLVTGKVKVC